MEAVTTLVNTTTIDTTAINMGFPDSPDSKESACNAGDLGSIPGLERSPGGGHGNPLQYFCLENLHAQRSLAGYSHGVTELDTTSAAAAVCVLRVRRFTLCS